MALIVLGLSGFLSAEAAAAIYVDGELVAAAEEERFIREKHAKNKMPLLAARFCLKQAGIRANKIDVVAFPFAKISLTSPARWHFARRHWYAPDVALDAIFNGNRHYRESLGQVRQLLNQMGIDWKSVAIAPVEHQLAHASSAYHLSGFEGKTAILSLDGVGEYASTLLGYGEAGEITKRKEFYSPDSLGLLYASMTEYLGLDAAHKVMASASYGDPYRYDLSDLASFDGKTLLVNNNLVNTTGLRRVKEGRRGYHFSRELIAKLGPRRSGMITDDPYVHYAAGTQQLLEDLTVQMLECYLDDVLEDTGQLVLAGSCAHNAKLNRRLLALPKVSALFAQPAAGDAGAALGAGAYACWLRKVRPKPMQSVYLGPDYTLEECIQACEQHSEKPIFKTLTDVPSAAAELIVAGEPVAWFQGRMEFGPRALGARSILGCPNEPGISDKINDQIKFREPWRSFSPSVVAQIVPEVIEEQYLPEFMNVSCTISAEWRKRIPEAVNRVGEACVHLVNESVNSRFYALLMAMEKLTGNAAVLNTSLNRRGEPIICTPYDALNMFFGSNLEYLFLENLLVTKRGLH